jgi:hypothetical protein
MLTDAQIVALLSRDGSREDMLREAARIGMRRAAEISERHFDMHGQWIAEAIRAAVGVLDATDTLR